MEVQSDLPGSGVARQATAGRNVPLKLLPRSSSGLNSALVTFFCLLTQGSKPHVTEKKNSRQTTTSLDTLPLTTATSPILSPTNPSINQFAPPASYRTGSVPSLHVERWPRRRPRRREGRTGRQRRRQAERAVGYRRGARLQALRALPGTSQPRSLILNCAPSMTNPSSSHTQSPTRDR